MKEPMPVAGIGPLPTTQWKLINIRKMDKKKWKESLQKLQAALWQWMSGHVNKEEAFFRIVIDAQLKGVGWNHTDGQGVPYEYQLADSTMKPWPESWTG